MSSRTHKSEPKAEAGLIFPTSLPFSLILPALNERERLPPYLAEIRLHLESEFGGQYEVIVVDDGSTDGMAETVTATFADWAQLRIERFPKNEGKGAAVRAGMLAAVGELLLFADADGATPIAEEVRLREALCRGADLAVGSRLLTSPEVQCHRTRFRAWIGRAFASLARTVLDVPVRDTQCGFKMLRYEVAQRLFGAMDENGYLFDLELLLLAERCGYRVAEVPVNWKDVPDSRMKMAGEAWRILPGLLRLRRTTSKRPPGNEDRR
jgi:dolichyl-phosphate beta-glucosyltransferase